MTATPYTTIRLWVRERMEEAGDPSTIPDDAVQHFLDNESFVSSLISTIVRREASMVIRQAEAMAPTAPTKDIPSALIPVPQAKENIIIDMASMRKADLLAWARNKKEEGDMHHRDAAFLLAIAETLDPTEKVGQRYTVDDLKRIRGNTIVQSDHKIFIGPKPSRLSFGQLGPGKE